MLSNAPSPKPWTKRAALNPLADVVREFQIAPANTSAIETRYTGRFPQIRPTTEERRPATPADQNCQPDQIATSAYVVSNSSTSTPVMGAIAGPITPAVPLVNLRLPQPQNEWIPLTNCSCQTQYHQCQVSLPLGPVLHKNYQLHSSDLLRDGTYQWVVGRGRWLWHQQHVLVLSLAVL